jgi:hypothetical protein
VSLYKQEKTAKVGIKIKREHAGWNNDYLLTLLNLSYFHAIALTGDRECLDELRRPVCQGWQAHPVAFEQCFQRNLDAVRCLRVHAEPPLQLAHEHGYDVRQVEHGGGQAARLATFGLATCILDSAAIVMYVLADAR